MDNSAYSAGAVSCTNGASIINCIFKNNKADGSSAQQCYGGAILSNEGAVEVENSSFIGNYAHDYGGAIYAKSVHINSKSYFINNVAGDNDGGAIYSLTDVRSIDSIFENNAAFEKGGAILSTYDFTVKNSTFKNNKVEGATLMECYGGAVFTTATYAEIDNSTFIGNYAYDYGGAISGQGAFSISSSTFIENRAGDNRGGAIYNDRGSSVPSREYKMNVVDSIFEGNAAYEDGGAIYTTVMSASVKNSIFKNNKAEGASSYQCYGGDIANHAGSDHLNEMVLKIDNCTFIGNHAYDYGGAISADSIEWADTPSYFLGNYVNDNQGGAIYLSKFITDVKNAVFIGNEAKANDDGGAIYINKENQSGFIQCTFRDNKCGDEGGAIYLDSSDSVAILINNSFVNNHAGNKGHDVFNKGTYGTINNNWWGVNNPVFSNKLVEWKATSLM